MASILNRRRRTQFDGIPAVFDFSMKMGGYFGNSLGSRLGKIPSGKVLDLGGGTGIRMVDLLGTEHKLTIADLSAPMLRRAVGLRGLQAVLTRAQELPFPDDTFDAVLMVDMLHHAGDSVACVVEAARVIAPGGMIYILDFESTNFAGKIALAVELALGFQTKFKPATFYTAILEKAGLEVSSTKTSAFEYLIKAKKI